MIVDLKVTRRSDGRARQSRDVGGTKERRPEGTAAGGAKRFAADSDADLGDAADVRASTAHAPIDIQRVVLTALTICGETLKERHINI